MKFFSIELCLITKFIAIGIIWGMVPVAAQLRNYSCWQEYWGQGNPCLLFLAGFFGYFLTSLYKHHLDSKKFKR